MNAPAELPAKITLGQTLIQGRCLAVRKAKDVFYHLVAMPAADPYSHPSTVEVSSSERLAEKDGDFRSLCRVTGYPRQFKQTDRDTGEEKIVRTADVKLQAVV